MGGIAPVAVEQLLTQLVFERPLHYPQTILLNEYGVHHAK